MCFNDSTRGPRAHWDLGLPPLPLRETCVGAVVRNILRREISHAKVSRGANYEFSISIDGIAE